MPVRVVLQAMDQAWLLVDNEERYVRAGRGVIVYIAFLDGVDAAGERVPLTDEDVHHAVETILKTKIFTHFAPEKMLTRPQSLEESDAMDILIVPQASLGGKVKKGHTVQFHQLVPKDVGAAMYAKFCHYVRVERGVDETKIDPNGVLLDAEEVPATGWLKYNGRVLSGTFGNRQGLKFESEGPFSHTFDL